MKILVILAFILASIFVAFILFPLILGTIKNIRKPMEYVVHIHDKYFDFMIDNDDLEDEPTIVSVRYNSLGKIIKVTRVTGLEDESTQLALNHFYKTCGINPYGGLKEFKKYTIYSE